MPALETPSSQETSAPSTPAVTEISSNATEDATATGSDENKAIEDALKKEIAGEKETLVESNEPLCRVGQMYEHGIGVEKNIQFAIKRYSYAANNVILNS